MSVNRKKVNQFFHDVYDEKNKRVKEVGSSKLEYYTEFLCGLAQKNGMYNSKKIINDLSELLGMVNADKTIIYIKLICARLCFDNKIHSAMAETLIDYMRSNDIDINEPTLDWDLFLFKKCHPYRPALKLSRRPRSTTFLYKNESAVLIQCLTWLKLTKPVVERFSFKSTPYEIKSYWDQHYDDQIEFHPKIMCMNSPWENSDHCNFTEFQEYLRFRYNGLCPSEPWFYKTFAGNLRNRKFTQKDYQIVIEKISNSKRLGKRYHQPPTIMNEIKEMKLAMPVSKEITLSEFFDKKICN